MKTVFFDIDTQFDFLLPAGALYVPGAEIIVDRIVALNRFAAAHGHVVISTVDAHAENDPEFQLWPHHCVTGTLGQHKPAATLLEKRLIVPNSGCDLRLEHVQQVLLEKQALDCFTNVNLQSLLNRLDADRYILYGVVTEICVKYAALGLLKTGKQIEIVTDAVRSLSEQASAETLKEFTELGAKLTTVEQVLEV